MDYRSVNLANKFALFSDLFSPKIIAQLNDYHFKLVKAQGEFAWHSHDDTDEAFLVLSGVLEIEFRNGNVTIAAGELFVVPKGVEHKPIADEMCYMMLIERAGTVNTGDLIIDMTAEDDVWI